ncbi:SpoIID/LytB domain-containing protein [Janibacter limosus]|jgi:SpoIID/LytB domain protein|uniref:SpoIID/LytB domain-containing protein n=1 Tax=Janibacter limosus TaxID=53458 RepID=UPI00082F048E|nr:SpoIID/LytB domain-containing protein [Janibacter limosus]
MPDIPPRRVSITALLAVVSALSVTLALAPSADARATSVPVTSSRATASSVPAGPWTFSGAGFGHGVGMSQYGALAQAKAGRSAQQILAFYYRGTTYDAVPDTQTIRVNIVRGQSSTSVVGRARSTGGGAVRVTAGSMSLRAEAGEAISVRRSGTVVIATCSTCTPTSIRGTSITTTWDERRTDLSLSGRSYRHAPLVFTPTPGAATLEGVLHLRLSDEYLDQVREVPWSWPTAAQQAQAAAARSYALRKVTAGVRSSCACHVTDGQADQVYGPVPEGSEATYWSRWREAVAVGGSATTGFVPRYQGQVIEALYSSSSSGRTVNNEDIWPGAPVPYLRGVADSWSTTADNPRRAWSVSVTSARLASAFGLPDVVSLDLSERTSAGTVRVARATSSTGTTRSLRGDDMRRALGLSSAFVRRPVTRVSGGTPADLAAVSAHTAPDTANTVIIASGAEDHAAHLVMSRPLAGSLAAPLLLTDPTRLPSPTTRELDRRGSRITKAYVVGGASMVASSVATQLRARGIVVKRVGSDNEDVTAAAIVDLMAGTGRIIRAGVFTRSTINEASAFSSVAALRREPIVWSSSTAVGYRAKAALRRAGVGNVRLLGSTTRIPTAVSKDLTAGGFRSMRFAGPHSHQVSAQIAEYFRPYLRATEVVLARTSPEGTVDAALAAGYGSPVLLVGTGVHPAVTQAVQSTPQWSSVRAFGPYARVSTTTLARVRNA